MELSGWIGGMLVAVSIIVITIMRWTIRCRVFRDRKPANIVEIYKKDVAKLNVSYDLFEKVISIVGQAFRVDPKLLRPSDKLRELYEADSWQLGEGIDQLNERIADEFGIVSFKKEPATVIELVLEIKNTHNRK